MSNILVTGGLGVNGSWVIRQLLEQGHTPIIYENRIDTALVPDIFDKLTVEIGDILDMANIIHIVKKYKIKLIVHLAALMPAAANSNPYMGYQVNILGTVNVLEAARIAEADRVVFTSSKGVYAPATGEHGYPDYKPITEEYSTYPQGMTTIYGSSKISSELLGIHYSENYGFEFIALRFATIYGIGKSVRHGSIAIHTKMIENAMVGKPTDVAQGGDEKDDMLYVKDCANAIVLACFAKSPEHHVFNIGNGRAYSLHDLAASIKKVYPKAVFNIGTGLNFMVNMPGAYCLMDYSRAQKELGYKPKYNLDDGVKDYIACMKQLNIEPVYRP